METHLSNKYGCRLGMIPQKRLWMFQTIVCKITFFDCPEILYLLSLPLTVAVELLTN